MPDRAIKTGANTGYSLRLWRRLTYSSGIKCNDLLTDPLRLNHA